MDAKKILIIDDEHTLLRLSQIIFQRIGYDVAVALSAKDGREFLLKNGAVDAIVLDLMMPEESGFDFLDWQEEQEESIKRIPVVVNTAKNLSAQDESFLRRRCARLMNKGIDFTDKLLSEVAEIL